MKKTAIFIALFFVGICAFAEELSVNMFMTQEQIDRVKAGEIITRMYIKYDQHKEATDLDLPVPSTSYAPVNYKDYQMITDEKAFLPYELTEETKMTFYNTISDANKLTDMQYYSRKADEVKTLVISAYPTTKKWIRIKNQQPLTEIQPHITGYFRQKDNKFGLLSFQSDLYNERNNFVLVNTCKTPIPFICFSDEYKTVTYFIYDEEAKGFYIYTAFLLVIRADSFLNGKGLMTLNPTTFSNRLRAATTHIGILLGQKDWADKKNPWDYSKLRSGGYRNY